MTIHAVWLDTEQAKSFSLVGDEFHSTEVSVHHHNAHSHLAKQRDTALMFKELAATLHNVDKLLILGPGQARTQFAHYLNDHFPAIGSKVVGCEALEQTSDAHIQNFSKEFFKNSAAKSAEISQ